jgi:protein TBF1
LNLATRSSKTIHQPQDQTSTPSDRAAKRRRTESSNRDASIVKLIHGDSLPVDTDGADQQLIPEDTNADLSELRSHLKAHVEQDGPSHENGLAPTETFGQLDPDMTKAISDIIDHSERFEQYCAMSVADDAVAVASKGLVFAKTGSRMKVESLPILDNLVSNLFALPKSRRALTYPKSSQILSTLAKSSYQDIIALMREPESDSGHEYSTVRSLFDHTKRVYSSKSPFLSPSELDLLEGAQVEVLRKANLATFVSSIFGSQEIGFAELNDNFLEIFVPENGRLLKAQGSLFLDLKTQAFISSMHTPDRSKTELLYTLFPDDLESRILARRPGARGLAPSEQDFVKRSFSRRDILLADVNNPAALDGLPEKYLWDDFLRDISSYISKNIELLNTQSVRSYRNSRLSLLLTEDNRSPN